MKEVEYPATVLYIKDDEDMELSTYTVKGVDGELGRFRDQAGLFEIGDVVRPEKQEGGKNDNS